MTGLYITHTETEYEVFYGQWSEGKKRETRLLCKRTKAPGVPNALLGQPYPIEEAYIRKMVSMNLWKKL